MAIVKIIVKHKKITNQMRKTSVKRVVLVKYELINVFQIRETNYNTNKTRTQSLTIELITKIYFL